MVTDGPAHGRRLPDEAFASHAKRPNPSADEHVAFPDESPTPSTWSSPLPPSAWAQHPQTASPQPPPEFAQIPPEVAAVLTSIAARQRPRSRSRLSPAGLGLTAVVALALIMSANTSTQPDDFASGSEQSWSQDGVWSSGTDGGLAVEALPGEVDSTMQPVDQPTYEIPLGPSMVRIEVVGDEAVADVVVTSDSGDAQLGEMALPFGAEIALEDRPDQLALTAHSRYGQGEIQCRIYAGDHLVSIATGVGLVECAAAPAR